MVGRAQPASVTLALALAACGNPNADAQTADPPAAVAEHTARASAHAARERTSPPPAPAREPACEGAVPVFDGGRRAGSVCPDQARSRGLTVIDLSDDWTPLLFAPGPDGQAPAYRDAFLALANGRLGGADMDMAREDRYFELYGVFPALSALRARLDGDDRHACHDAVDDGALAAVTRVLREEPRAAALARKRRARALGAALDQQVKRRRLADLDALAAVNAYYRRSVARYRAAQAEIDAIRAAQAHLVCEGLLDPRQARQLDGLFTWQLGDALGAFQRKHFLLGNGPLGQATRAAMLADSRELDFRAALRALRERVAGAAGLIEDGSARGEPLPILGRVLDPVEMQGVRGLAPVVDGGDGGDGAPDRIAAATEAAAIHLGWTDLAGVRAFLAEHAPAVPGAIALRVAVRLPPVPDYHAAHMEIEAVLDRGGSRRGSARAPALTVYAVHGERRIALVRWPTTIGGWQDFRTRSGAVIRKHMASPPGPRVWRDMYAAPTWFAPDNTPDADLVRRVWSGKRRYAAKQEVIGPGYRSAFGLVMLVHHLPYTRRGAVAHHDQGIRTHGSANFLSIVGGTSHGCHRLFNHHAVRLSSFLLGHRDHVRHGQEIGYYRRVVRRGGTFVIQRDTRGYRFELTPPVPITVSGGTTLR